MTEEEQQWAEMAGDDGGAGAVGGGGTAVIDLSTLDDGDREKITKIQALYRGNKGREKAAEVKTKGGGEAAAPAADGKVEIDLASMSPEDQAKIVKIQARHRGNAARQDVEKKRATTDGGKGAAKAKPSQKPKQEEFGAGMSDADLEQITKIQAMQRGRMAREEVAQKREANQPDPITMPARESDESTAKKTQQRKNRWVVDPNRVGDLKLTGGAKGMPDGKGVAPHAQQAIHQIVMRRDDWW